MKLQNIMYLWLFFVAIVVIFSYMWDSTLRYLLTPRDQLAVELAMTDPYIEEYAQGHPLHQTQFSEAKTYQSVVFYDSNFEPRPCGYNITIMMDKWIVLNRKQLTDSFCSYLSKHG